MIDAHFLDADGVIDLKAAYADRYGACPAAVAEFLDQLVELQLIRSRQVAALALVSARQFDNLEEARYGSH